MHFAFSQYFIYIVFVAVITAFSYINKLNKTDVFAYLMYSFVLLMAVLRIDTGADYATYIEMHERVGKSGFQDMLDFTEPLFFWLLKLIYVFTDDYWIMFAVVSFFIYTVLFLALKKLSTDIALSLILYVITSYYFISINQLRQSISLVIFLYSLTYIINAKPGKYFLLNLIGVGFHYSAAIVLFLYPLFRINFSRRNLIIIYLASIVLSIFIEKMFVSSLSALDLFYAQYFDMEEYMEKNYLALGKVVIPNLILIYSIIQFKNFSKAEYSIFLVFFASIIYYNIFFGKHIFIRPGMYFEIVTILYIPIFIKKFFSITMGLVVETFLIIYYFFAVTLYGILINGGQGVVPYKFIFSR